MLPDDDGCDLMTDGFYPLKKLSTRFVTAHGDLVPNGVDGVILFGGSGVLIIKYVLLLFFVLFWCFGCKSISTWKTGISSLSLRWIRSSGRLRGVTGSLRQGFRFPGHAQVRIQIEAFDHSNSIASGEFVWSERTVSVLLYLSLRLLAF